MEAERFRHSPAGRLVKRDAEPVPGGREEQTPYWAFVPNPLPPDIVLRLDSELGRLHSEADRALAELGGLGRTMANPHLLIGPFIRREAVLSSRIEGTQADINDLYAYEARQLASPGTKRSLSAPSDAREVSNYVRALEHGEKRLEEIPVCLRLLKEMHAVLMEGVRGEDKRSGEFRDGQNLIGPDVQLENARFIPPPADELERVLSDFEAYVHFENGFPPLVRLALIHYQFEAIHPFRDGNGRIGRLLVSLLIVHWKLLPSPLLYLSAFFEKHRQTYYDLLLAVSEHGAWEEWIAFFLEGVVEQSRDAIARAKDLQDLQQRWTEQLTAARAYKARALADLLFEAPALTVPRAQKWLGLKNYQSAHKLVGRLVESGILTKAPKLGAGATLYFAEDIIRILTALE